jgi:HD-like signal output (HDOD) protein
LSYVIAKKKSNIDPEQALLAGMVHNIGTLPLIMKLNSIEGLKQNPKALTLVADVVIPKLYKQAGQLIMKNWHFPDDITFAVKHHAEKEALSENGVALNNIIQIAFQLSQLNGHYDIDAPPANLTDLQTFPNFWNGWASAVLELNTMQADIEQMQYEISH